MLIVIILVVVAGLILFLNNQSQQQLHTEMAKARQEQNQILSNAINMMEAKVNANHELTSREKSNTNQEILTMINQLQQNLSGEVKANSQTNKEISENIVLLKSLYNQIDKLESEVNSLSKVLDDKQLRGAFGERRLSQILEQNYGSSSSLFSEQVMLSNGKRADVMINYPDGFKKIVIDAKFPLDNYKRLSTCMDEERVGYEKQFINDVKKHISVIANKYIIDGETAPSAMMFIPSEAVYYHLLKLDEQIIDFAYSMNVWIVSPTTVMAILTSLDVALKDTKLNENLITIRKELMELGNEFIRFDKRFNDYNTRFRQMEAERDNLTITANKLIKKFNEITISESKNEDY